MLYKDFVRPALFALGHGDAEEAHNIVKKTMRITQQIPPLLFAIDFFCQAYYNPNPVDVLGIRFPNRVGLAAGFDKNAEVLPFMQALGFGFAEIGAVLPDEQVGNERPRIFRVPEYGGIINRMGFNSAGAKAVRNNLKKVRGKLRIPVGINIGKMRDTPPNIADEDYCNVVETLHDCGDYYTANFSSPNTRGLRDLQTPKFVMEIVTELVRVSNDFGGKPVLVKFDPDMPLPNLLEAVEAAMAAGAGGIILTNTTTTRPPAESLEAIRLLDEPGGMSGDWLFERSLERVKYIHERMPEVMIIAAGGINSVERELKMLDAGATLIQIYTGLIYEGPDLVRKLRFIL